MNSQLFQFAFYIKTGLYLKRYIITHFPKLKIINLNNLVIYLQKNSSNRIIGAAILFQSVFYLTG